MLDVYKKNSSLLILLDTSTGDELHVRLLSVYVKYTEKIVQVVRIVLRVPDATCTWIHYMVITHSWF